MDKRFFLGLFVVAMMSGVAVSADETVGDQAEAANVEVAKKEVAQDAQNEQQDETAEQGCGCGH